MNTDSIEPEWWNSLYDSLLADMLLEDDDKNEIAQTISFLEKNLRLRPGDRIFDQCCGTGRISIPLVTNGYKVTGVDLIESYIDRAKAKALEQNLSINFQAQDAFTFTASPEFDGAFNWWTSFGYFETDKENIGMLLRAYESLKQGGRFALDFMNVPGVIHHFKPEVITKGTSLEHGELTLIRESELDVERGLLLKTWTYVLENGEKVVHHSRVRMYTPVELNALFDTAGFRDIKIFGDLNSSPIAIDSPRCIVVGEK